MRTPKDGALRPRLKGKDSYQPRIGRIRRCRRRLKCRKRRRYAVAYNPGVDSARIMCYTFTGFYQRVGRTSRWFADWASCNSIDWPAPQNWITARRCAELNREGFLSKFVGNMALCIACCIAMLCCVLPFTGRKRIKYTVTGVFARDPFVLRGTIRENGGVGETSAVILFLRDLEIYGYELRHQTRRKQSGAFFHPRFCFSYFWAA